MLGNVILKQKAEKERLLSLPYVERSRAGEARKWLDSDLIKVIVGPRRAGKSVFALMLLQERSFAYFNFDDESFRFGEPLDLDELLAGLLHVYGSDVQHLFFDEVQNLPGWELFVNRLQRNGYNIVLTGSNASLLSKELATHLTGRHVPIEILPLSFSEILRAREYTYDVDRLALPEEKAQLLALMGRYLTEGGYPEVVLKGADPRGYLDVLFDALLFTDVVKRHNVRAPEHIARMASYLVDNVACHHGVKRLTHVLGFKSEITVDQYLEYLLDAYLLFALPRYSPKAGMRLRSQKKYYAVDNGFVTTKAVRHAPDNGKLMENLVFTELVKRGMRPGRELFYYKTRNDREVDFLLMFGTEVDQLVQVSFDTAVPDVLLREVKALVEAGEEVRCTNLTVLTWNESQTLKRDGATIHLTPLWQWLHGDR